MTALYIAVVVSGAVTLTAGLFELIDFIETGN